MEELCAINPFAEEMGDKGVYTSESHRGCRVRLDRDGVGWAGTVGGRDGTRKNKNPHKDGRKNTAAIPTLQLIPSCSAGA